MNADRSATAKGNELYLDFRTVREFEEYPIPAEMFHSIHLPYNRGKIRFNTDGPIVVMSVSLYDSRASNKNTPQIYEFEMWEDDNGGYTEGIKIDKSDLYIIVHIDGFEKRTAPKKKSTNGKKTILDTFDFGTVSTEVDYEIPERLFETLGCCYVSGYVDFDEDRNGVIASLNLEEMTRYPPNVIHDYAFRMKKDKNGGYTVNIPITELYDYDTASLLEQNIKSSEIVIHIDGLRAEFFNKKGKASKKGGFSLRRK